jgi:hypothetical protein
MSIIDYFMPTPGQGAGLLAVVATMTAFSLIGAALSGKGRLRAADAFAGWGAVSAVFILLGVFTKIPFTWLAYGIWAAAAVSAVLVWRRGPADFGILWRAVVLALPLFALVSAMKASQWDEFSQWLPNAWYIYRNDGFPGGAAMPVSPSVFPAYPYGLPLVTYLVSVLRGSFVENGGALTNLSLLLLYTPVYLHMIGQGLKADDGWAKTWGGAALGVLGVTVLSTTFVQKLVFTAYADSATAVILAVVGVLSWKILQVLAKEAEGGKATATAWQFSLASAVFLNLKQTNLVLLVLLLGGVSLVALRDKKIRAADFFRLLPVMLALPAVMYLAWRYHVSLYLQAGEFSLMPFANWRVPQAFEIFGRMLLIASRKGAYFIMMLVITAFAARAFIRVRDGFDRMALITGAVFTGYVLFLWLMYIAAFSGAEALRAASFWRYNTQLGLLGATTAAFGLARFWQRRQLKLPRLLSALAVFLVLAIPLATSSSLRFDIRPQKDHMRMVGQDLAKILPAGVRFAVIDQRGQGLAGKIVNFELSSGVNSRPGLKVYFNGRMFKSPAALRKALESRKIAYIWVHEPVPLVLKALGLNLAPAASYLLARDRQKWKVVKSWPYNGYTDPFSFPD